jgi:hypothetical protein
MKHFKLIKQTQTQMFMRGAQTVRTQAVAAAMDSRPVYTRGVTPNSFFVATQSRGFAASKTLSRFYLTCRAAGSAQHGRLHLRGRRARIRCL